jgi:hypothetical protein
MFSGVFDTFLFVVAVDPPRVQGPLEFATPFAKLASEANGAERPAKAGRDFQS